MLLAERSTIYIMLMLIGMPLCAYAITRIWRHDKLRLNSLLIRLSLVISIIIVASTCHFTTLSPDVNWLLNCLVYLWLNVVFWRCSISSEISIRVLGYAMIGLSGFTGTLGLFPAVLASTDNHYDSDKQLGESIYFRTGQRGFASAGATELQIQVTQRFVYLPGIERIILDTTLIAPLDSEVETLSHSTATGNALIYRIDKGKEHIIFACGTQLKSRVMVSSQ
jgi:hypothetical protein